MSDSNPPDDPREHDPEALIRSSDRTWPSDPEARKEAIRLELKRIRSAASAARLESRAAELELMLRQLEHSDGDEKHRSTHPPKGPLNSEEAVPLSRMRNEPFPLSEIDMPRGCESDDSSQAEETETKTAATDLSSTSMSSTSTWVRQDQSHSKPRRPAFLDVESRVDESPQEKSVVSSQKPNDDFELSLPTQDDAPVHKDDESLVENDNSAPPPTSRKQHQRPIAWIVSACAHAILLVALGWFTLTSTVPKDQISLVSSPVPHSVDPIQSISIESQDIEVQPESSMVSESSVAISPFSDIVVAKFSPQSTQSPVLSDTRLLAKGTGMSLSLSGSPVAKKMEFCGIQGGGNHFVYLVDSSGSMGEAFDSARSELLRSIRMLQPDQRFYVVFFDEDADYMRLSDPTQPEPASVMATPENKEKLAQWAMGISMDRGLAPYEPLEFALALKPDAIFLLSDGEFPQRLVTKLDQENRVENLFGDVKPISVIHTIAYHSKEGESRMKRIAERNRGQFRYVPRPSK